MASSNKTAEEAAGGGVGRDQDDQLGRAHQDQQDGSRAEGQEEPHPQVAGTHL